jgi:hypothetical protein
MPPLRRHALDRSQSYADMCHDLAYSRLVRVDRPTRPRRGCDVRFGVQLDGLLRSVRLPLDMSPEDVPSGVRDAEGDEDLLERRVQGYLPSDARLPRLLRQVPATPMRKSQDREEAGQEGVPGRETGLQVRGKQLVSRLRERGPQRHSADRCAQFARACAVGSAVASVAATSGKS